MAVWGRLEDVETGVVHKLIKHLVSLGRAQDGVADIGVKAVPNSADEYFCSAKHFELRYINGKPVIKDTSTNGTFLNIGDEESARQAFKNAAKENKWLKEQLPNPRLKKDTVCVCVCVSVCLSVCLCICVRAYVPRSSLTTPLLPPGATNI